MNSKMAARSLATSKPKNVSGLPALHKTIMSYLCKPRENSTEVTSIAVKPTVTSSSHNLDVSPKQNTQMVQQAQHAQHAQPNLSTDLNVVVPPTVESSPVHDIDAQDAETDVDVDLEAPLNVSGYRLGRCS